MSSSRKGTSLLTESGIGLLITVLAGAGLGFVFSGDLFNKPPHQLMQAIALGLVWAALILNWVDLIIQTLGLGSDPVPEALEITDKESVKEYLESPSGSSGLAVRAHRLLESIANGASGAQVAQQAALQSQQARSSLNGFVVFNAILLTASLYGGGNTLLSWAALLLLAITVFARRNYLAKVDGYIETSVISKATAGGGAPASSGADASKSTEALTKAVESAFGGMKGDLEKLSSSVNGLGEKLSSAGGSWGSDLSGIFSQHADSVTSASQHLATQLDKILSMQQNIDKALKVGDAVDKVAEAVSATAEFQQTLAALRNHVEESDKMMKELTKPRKIRLVESSSQG